MQNLKPNTSLSAANTANFIENKTESWKESAHEFKKPCKTKDYFPACEEAIEGEFHFGSIF